MSENNSDWMARIFAKESQPTEADRALAMEKTIREMSRDTYNPNALRAPEKVKVANAVQTVDDAPKPVNRSGWQEERPLPIHSAKGSREEALIDRMAEKFVGPPVGRPKEEPNGSE